MTTERNGVGLKAWQWIIVIIIALAGGILGGLFGGGVNITIMESDVSQGTTEAGEDFEVDEDD